MHLGRFVASSIVGCVLLVAASPHDAHADGGGGANECLKASEDGQAARDRGKLRDARKSFVTCASDGCPKALRIDCARWLEDVDASLPTVVFGAKDSHGADLFDVTVLVDGERVVGHEQGKAVPLDPGPHLIRFETKGKKPFEEKVLLRAGERNRSVIASFEDVLLVKDDKEKDKDKDTSSSGGAPIATYIFGALGIAALGSFTVFAITGTNEKARLRTTCSPVCTNQQISALKADYIVADISLGIGVVAIGLATYFLLSNGSAKTSSSSSSSSSSSTSVWQDYRFARTIWK